MRPEQTPQPDEDPLFRAQKEQINRIRLKAYKRLGISSDSVVLQFPEVSDYAGTERLMQLDIIRRERLLQHAQTVARNASLAHVDSLHSAVMNREQKRISLVKHPLSLNTLPVAEVLGLDAWQTSENVQNAYLQGVDELLELLSAPYLPLSREPDLRTGIFIPTKRTGGGIQALEAPTGVHGLTARWDCYIPRGRNIPAEPSNLSLDFRPAQ